MVSTVLVRLPSRICCILELDREIFNSLDLLDSVAMLASISSILLMRCFWCPLLRVVGDDTVTASGLSVIDRFDRNRGVSRVLG